MKHNASPEAPLTLPMPFDEAIERFARVNTRDTEPAPCPRGATPFVKWVGGKRSIIDELVELLPSKFGDYYEPFAGGAALFFAIHERITKAFLSDSNFELTVTFAVVKKDPDALIAKLEEHARKDSDKYYYKIRAQRDLQAPIDIAARFIYLNKTCYNGLYRVNKKGEFNVPRGSYVKPDVVQHDNIMASSKALRKANITYREFDAVKPQPGDFVYCDPPYHPSDNGSYTKYTKLGFSEKDQERLSNFGLALYKANVKVMLSNSNTAFIRSLYVPPVWNVTIVQAPRLVNCKSEGRGAVSELVIRNYK